jgi:hypothetical protein
MTDSAIKGKWKYIGLIVGVLIGMVVMLSWQGPFENAFTQMIVSNLAIPSGMLGFGIGALLD